MNTERALFLLLRAVEVDKGRTVVSASSPEFSADVIDWFCKQGLLAPVGKASSVECNGCEYRCISEVHDVNTGGKRRYFVVCEEPEMQPTMGRITIDPQSLKRWKCDALMLAKVCARLLGIESQLPKHHSGPEPIQIGMLTDKGNRRWLVLEPSQLCLEVNGRRMPLLELLYADGDGLAIGRSRLLKALATADDVDTGSGYQPNIDKREARKQATRRRNERWKAAYADMTEVDKAKGDLWCARKIARMDIGEGKSPDTIRKVLGEK